MKINEVDAQYQNITKSNTKDTWKKYSVRKKSERDPHMVGRKRRRRRR